MPAEKSVLSYLSEHQLTHQESPLDPNVHQSLLNLIQAVEQRFVADPIEQTIFYYWITAAIESGVLMQEEQLFTQNFTPSGSEYHYPTTFHQLTQFALLDNLEKQNVFHDDTKTAFSIIKKAFGTAPTDDPKFDSFNHLIATWRNDQQQIAYLNKQKILEDIQSLMVSGRRVSDFVNDYLESTFDVDVEGKPSGQINGEKLEHLIGDFGLYLTSGPLLSLELAIQFGMI